MHCRGLGEHERLRRSGPASNRITGVRERSAGLSPTAQIAPGWAWRGKGEEKPHALHCAGSGEKLPRAPQGPTRAGLQLDGAGKVFSTKRLSTVGRWDEAAKRKTTLRPPRRIGTAPLPPRLFPRAPIQCGQRAPTKERTGGIFQCVVGFTRGVELSPPFRECSPHRTHSKGGRSCLALQGRPNCARTTLSPYTPT